MKVICPKCQTANPKSSQFCSQCGSRLTSELETTITFAGPIEVTEEEKLDLERLALEGPLLVVVKGMGIGETFKIGEVDLLIGRDPNNDVFLDDITVSRKHAQIKREAGRLRLVDAGSLNGTYLNKQRVDAADIKDGDEIQIGKFRMLFLDKTESRA